MAKQVINPKQSTFMVNGTEYENCYFVSGSTNFSVTSTGDYDVDTGVAKFPNNLLAFGVMPGWTSVTWSQSWKKGLMYQGTTNLRLSIYFAGSSLTKTVQWWALGN